MLGNIHPKYRSSLKTLNLAILCPTKCIKKYGLTKILKPFMADIALLESVSEKDIFYTQYSTGLIVWCRAYEFLFCIQFLVFLYRIASNKF